MNEHSPMYQRVKAFEKANGNDGINLGDFILFSNGACRDSNPIGALIDPPQDPSRRASNIVRYWEARTMRARARFTEVKAHYVTHAKGALAVANVPEPLEPIEAVTKQLQELQAEVLKCQTQLETAREQLGAIDRTTPEGQARQQREQRNAAARQANSDLLAAISNIQI